MREGCAFVLCGLECGKREKRERERGRGRERERFQTLVWTFFVD